MEVYDSEVPNAFVTEVLPQRFFITTGMVRVCVRACTWFLSHTFWCCSLDSCSMLFILLKLFLLPLYGFDRCVCIHMYICLRIVYKFIYIHSSALPKHPMNWPLC